MYLGRIRIIKTFLWIQLSNISIMICAQAYWETWESVGRQTVFFCRESGFGATVLLKYIIIWLPVEQIMQFFFYIFQINKYSHLVYIYSSFIVHMYKCTYICTYVHNVRVRLDGGWERNGCHVKLADLIVFFLRRLRQLLTIHRKWCSWLLHYRIALLV